MTDIRLSQYTEVRKEDFGLLFYTMTGPRLYFLSSGESLDPDFFEGRITLDQWVKHRKRQNSISKARFMVLKLM